jgi:O-antigen ligase
LRAYGTFAQPNPYGGYLGLVLPLALSLTLWRLAQFSRPDSNSFSNLFYLALVGVPLVVLLAALFASLSRGAWLAFGLATVAVFALYNKKTLALMTMALFLGSLLALMGSFNLGTSPLNTSYNALIQRLVEAGAIFTITDIGAIEVNDTNFATIERLAHWQAAAHMWRDNLWLGVGFGNYAVVYPAYAIGRWTDPLGHAHNYLLNLGAETGLFGITAYLIFWILAFGVLWRAVQQSDGFYRAVAVGGIGIMVHLHIHNLFDNLYVQGMYLHIAIVLALVSAIYRRKEDDFCQC